MPRYSFHLHDGETTDDLEGSELSDLAAARDQALVGARSLMAADIRGGRLDLGDWIQVTDEQNRELFRLSFCDAVTITGGSQGSEEGAA